MPSIKFLDLARKVLEREKRPLTSDEIWAVAEQSGLAKEVGTRGLTPWSTLGAQLYVDVRDNPKSAFAAVGSRPKRFTLKTLLGNGAVDPALIATPTPAPSKPRFLEADLHPFVVHFGFNYLHAYLKTIRHQLSPKSEFGEWVHPDIVGCYFPFTDWRSEVVDLSERLGSPALRLYSFELKRELDMRNLREAFFQTVSNSSWANESYLCAAGLSTNDDFLAELERLCSAFGIGVIDIDTNDPNSTRITIPARTRDRVDWETVDKLSFNPDFQEFLARVRDDADTKTVIRERYDKVLSDADLIASIPRI
jgi:hypothetical protein